MRSQIIATLAFICAATWASAAGAFDPPASTFSSGEVSPVASCFFECKNDGRNVFEDTHLMLINESTVETLDAEVLLIDAHEQAMVRFRSQLSPLDLDEVNVCRTLERAGILPPQAGVIEIVSIDASSNAPEGGVYSWIKDIVSPKRIDQIVVGQPGHSMSRAVSSDILLDRPAGQPDPVIPKVRKFIYGIGKTECRVTPPEVYGGGPGISQIRARPARQVVAVYEEETDEAPNLPGGLCNVTSVLCATNPGAYAVNCIAPDSSCVP